MRDVSQRELRNQSGEIVRGLDRGESFRITCRGRPVGTLTPATVTAADQHVTRRGTQAMADLPPGAVLSGRSSGELLDALRDER